MRKILYLHNKDDIGGGEISLLNLWKNLDREKFEPYLILPEEGQLSQLARDNGLAVNICPVPKISVFNAFKIAGCVKFINSYIKTNKIDLLHSYSPRNNIIGAVCAKNTKIPIIWHERNMIFGKEKDITRTFLSVPDAVICNSNAIARRFEHNGKLPEKVNTILNGVDINFYRPGFPENDGQKIDFGGDKVVGLVSNLNRRKNVDFFLHVASRVAGRRDDVVFVVVGGEFAGEKSLDGLVEEAARLGLEQKVIFPGFVPDVRPYVGAFDVSVNVTHREACSRAILESMACAKPVIAFNEGGNPELIDDARTGMLVETGDLEAFSRSVIELLENDDKRRMMGEAARKRVEEKFDVRKNASATQELYSRLIRGKQ